MSIQRRQKGNINMVARSSTVIPLFFILITMLISACGQSGFTNTPAAIPTSTSTFASAAATESITPSPARRPTNTLVPFPTYSNNPTPDPTSTPFPLAVPAGSAAGELVILKAQGSQSTLWKIALDANGKALSEAVQIPLAQLPAPGSTFGALGEIFPSPDKQKLFIILMSEGPDYLLADLETGQIRTAGWFSGYQLFYGWHADSAHVLIGTGSYSYQQELQLANIDGDGIVPLAVTEALDHTHIENAIASPDGQRIRYLLHTDSNVANQVWEIDSNGTRRRHLLDLSIPGSLTWSPDGKKIAYWDEGFWITDADGSNLRKLNDARYHYQFIYDLPPTWSPDSHYLIYQLYGKQIAGESMLNGSNIFLMDMQSGETRTILPDGGTGNLYPVWSPDGQKIAFLSNRAGTPDIWVVNRDGSDLHRVTTTGDIYRVILWRAAEP